MTLVVERHVDGPATHALVIGVSYYRHLPGGAGPFLDNPLGLAQLSAPEASARQVLSFLTDEYRHAGAPLATVELLMTPMSGPAPETVSGEPLESPTMASVRTAVQRWFGRCNSDPGNVAFFYFCGHGIERDSQYLLMEDFGAFEPALLENTLDLIAFHRGLAQCAAGTQLSFIDACREVPRELKQFVTGTGQGLLDARLDGNLSRDAPILWAAAQGRKAFACGGRRHVRVAVAAFAGGAGASATPRGRKTST